MGVAGGFGRPTDNKSIIGTVVVAPLKELAVVFNPGWTKAESLSDRQIQRVDVGLFTLGLGAASITRSRSICPGRRRGGRSDRPPHRLAQLGDGGFGFGHEDVCDAREALALLD